jgi:hypothetical protein
LLVSCPYFAIALYVKTGKFEFKRYLKYFLSVGIPAAFLIAFGKNVNEGDLFRFFVKEEFILPTEFLLEHQ